MPMLLEKWVTYLKFDTDSAITFEIILNIVEPEIDAIIDSLYEHITQSEGASDLFKTEDSLLRARAAQKHHWLTYVLRGRFDQSYIAQARAVGERHFHAGVDLLFYTGAYALVQHEITALLCKNLHRQPADLQRALSVLNRAIFLDMGLAVSVYYDFLIAASDEMANELAFSLARAGDFRDNETGEHLLRMSAMCRMLARAAGQDERWASRIAIASPLHDVGKIGIPDNVLLKPGRLVGEELMIMQRHPQIGGEIIPNNPSEVIQMARRIALTHHERWDGTGYPAGLRGEEIPLEGRIAAICDVYDALLSDRPYKRPWSHAEAVEYFEENRAKHFDPALVAVFLDILPEIDAARRAL